MLFVKTARQEPGDGVSPRWSLWADAVEVEESLMKSGPCWTHHPQKETGGGQVKSGRTSGDRGRPGFGGEGDRGGISIAATQNLKQHKNDALPKQDRPLKTHSNDA